MGGGRVGTVRAPDDHAEGTTRKWCQDDGCQEGPCAIAMETFDTAQMTTSPHGWASTHGFRNDKINHDPPALKLSGFLSYRDPVELDFSGFDLACISGSNGAGKSSLLDAMTWALFGQARKRDEAVINLQSKAAEVAFTFAYETNTYRVMPLALPRGKDTPSLEFQIVDATPA